MQSPKAQTTPKKTEDKLVKLPSTLQAEEEDEPLLVENKQRFVLFPIKYHDVSKHPNRQGVIRVTNGDAIDLANVQEGRGLVLDRRGD